MVLGLQQQHQQQKIVLGEIVRIVFFTLDASPVV